MAEHPIKGLMDVTMEKIRQMVDSNTIIGNPINLADGTTVLPVSKDLFGGGSGAGVTIAPVAFLVVQPGGNVRLIQLTDTSNNIDRALSLLPEMMDKITALVKKDQAQEQE